MLTPEALKELKEAHVTHADIKESNIMRDPNTKQIKLIDLGLSHVGKGHISSRGTTGIELFTDFCHLSGYMAPEMETGPHCDMYSAGVVFGKQLAKHIPIVSLQFLGTRSSLDYKPIIDEVVYYR